MKYFSLLLPAAMFAAACGLTACGSTDKVDVKYPTVQQMDDLDVQWGLTRRKPRGTPTRSLNYDAGGTAPTAAAATAPISAPSFPDPVLEPPPIRAAPTSPAMVIPDQLR